MTRFMLLAAAALTMTAAACAGTASARLTKAEYLADLRTADAISSRSDNAALAALQSRKTSPIQVRDAFYAMGKAHFRIGTQFAALVPPRAATKANRDFAAAEILLGRQNEAIARHLPNTKPAIVKYLRSLKPPTGGARLDRAITELHAAGFKIR
jgi:hypothetical protein